jgi:hypothetical protein
MAAEVLANLMRALESDVFAPLREVHPAKNRLHGLLDAIDAFYRGGKDACLLERLGASTEALALRKPLQEAFNALMKAFEDVARDAGLKPSVARSRAEDAVIRIEGALVVCAGTGEMAPFARMLDRLRRGFLEGSDHS